MSDSIYDKLNERHQSDIGTLGMPGGAPNAPLPPYDYASKRPDAVAGYDMAREALMAFFKATDRPLREAVAMPEPETLETVEQAQLCYQRSLSLLEAVRGGREALNQVVHRAAVESGESLSRLLSGPDRYCQFRVSRYAARLEELKEQAEQLEAAEAARQERAEAYRQWEAGRDAALEIIRAGGVPPVGYENLVPAPVATLKRQ